MKNTVNISKIFPDYLFWDMDSSKLSVDTDFDIIIPRALYASTKQSFEKDIARLEKLYSKEQIISCLQKTKERISNSICLMVANKYNVEPFKRFSL
ncbi:DUF6922 domain-containing protein [Saccharicrinis sp. 156]|uniref:DUF6922 domain-containing protein n=1 Tax=Saccharicrinis sp. 156 TaxID=3417574 RepID=UPI003D34135B